MAAKTTYTKEQLDGMDRFELMNAHEDAGLGDGTYLCKMASGQPHKRLAYSPGQLRTNILFAQNRAN